MEEIKKDAEMAEESGEKEEKDVKKNPKTVLPIEDEVAAQDENATWYQKNKKAVIIAIAVVSVLIIGCVVGLILYNKHYQSLTRGVLFYQDNGCVMTDKAVFQDVAYSAQANSWNFNEKGENNNENPAVVSTDGKYVYWTQNDNGSTFDLYCAKKGSKKTTLICQAATDYEVAGKGEVYFASNGSLYLYLVKDGEIQSICNDATTFCLNEKKDTVLAWGGSEGKLTSIKTEDPGSLVVLETGVTKVIEAGDEFKTIVYEKADGLYMLTVKSGEIVKIGQAYAECYVYNADKKCEVYYLTDAREVYYYKEGGKETELVVSEVWRFHGADSDAAAFFVAVGPISEQCVYRLVAEGEAIEMKDVTPMDIKDDIYIDANDKKAYFVGYADDNDTVGTLYSMGYQMLNKGKVEVVDNNVVSIEYMEHKKMYIGKDAGDGTVDLYYNSALVARNIVPHSTKMSADGRVAVFAYQTSDADGDRKLVMYDGEIVTELGSSAGADYCAVSAKEIYFMQNGEAGFDLMKYNGRKVKELLTDIDDYKFLFY